MPKHKIRMDLNCTICDRPINVCECPGHDREAEAIMQCGPNGVLASRWCLGCDCHYGWCECDEPDWVVRSGGKMYPLPAHAEMTARRSQFLREDEHHG